MTVQLHLQCSGPDGPNNGCPEGYAGFHETSADSHNDVKDAWARLQDRAITAGWTRKINQNHIQCPECAARGPATISGLSMEVWDRAMALYLDGKPPSEWGGRDGLPTPSQFNNACQNYPEYGEKRKASPLWIEGAERADPVSPEVWAEVERRFLAGEEKRDICIGRAGWPTSGQWESRAERDEAFASLVRDERARRQSEAEAKVDAALGVYEMGTGIYLSDILDGPTRNRWWKRMQDDQPFAERVAGARERNIEARWKGKHHLYEQTLEAYASGTPIAELTRKAEGRVTYSALRNMVGWDAAFAARFTHGMARRQAALDANRGRRGRLPGQAPTFDMTLDWDGTIEDVQWGEHITQALDKPNRPSMNQWNRRRRLDPAFAQAADDAVEIRKVVREELKSQKAQEEARRKEDARQTLGNKIKGQLSQNDLFATVNRCVPVGLPTHIRDDVVGAMVLAVLEGELSLDQVPKRAREFTAAYHREAGTYSNMSIDAPIAGTDDLRLIDTLTQADTWRLRQ